MLTKNVPITVRKLEADDLDQLLHLCTDSYLPTLQNKSRLRHLLASDEELIFGVFDGEYLAGCSCLVLNEQKTYVSNKNVYSFSLPNVCLCGTYVHADFRSRGLGSRLYSARLQAAMQYGIYPLIVELFGDGTNDSIHPYTMPGYHFHMKHGFKELGYSTDEDGGKILIYQPNNNFHQ